MILRLKFLREAQGLSVKDMCARLGVADSRYRKWESGTNGLPVDYAIACCSILHCTLDELCGRVGPSLDDDERELLALYRSATPELRSAALAVLRSRQGVEAGQVIA